MLPSARSRRSALRTISPSSFMSEICSNSFHSAMRPDRSSIAAPNLTSAEARSVVRRKNLATHRRRRGCWVERTGELGTGHPADRRRIVQPLSSPRSDAAGHVSDYQPSPMTAVRKALRVRRSWLAAPVRPAPTLVASACCCRRTTSCRPERWALPLRQASARQAPRRGASGSVTP